MKKNNLAAELEAAGIEKRFAIDIGSVLAGARPKGLMHLPIEKVAPLEKLLCDLEMKKLAGRKLFRSFDPSSREGVLSESRSHGTVAWYEIWFCRNDAQEPVSADELFRQTGEHLGYPKCCQSAMQTDNCLAALYHQYIHNDRNRFWELNRLAALFHPTILMPDFFPCSLACKNALNFVEKIQSAANVFLDPRELVAAQEAMKAPITIIGDSIVSWQSWTVSKGRMEVLASSARKENLADIANTLVPSEPSKAVLLSFGHLTETGVSSEIRQLVVLDKAGGANSFPLTVN